MAVRIALGATGGRVARLLLQQSIVIVAAGAALGVPLAWLALRTLQRLDLGPTVSVFVGKAQLDLGVLLATAVIAIVAALAAGALPAWFNRETSLGDALRASSRSATLSAGALRWQKVMVVGQAALSAAILAAAVLIGLSFWRLMDVPSGFTAQDRVVMKVVLPATEYGTHPQRAGFARMLTDNLAADPAIASAGFTTTLPVSDIMNGGRFFIELPDGSRSTEPVLFHFRRVSPAYLETMGIPLLSGRQLTTHDDTSSLAVAIVSRALAERLWPNENAIGKRLLRAGTGQAPPTPVTVVGIAGNTMDAGYSAPAGEAVYVPYAQVSSARLSIVARSRGDVRATIAGMRRAIRKTDPKLAASDIATLDALVVGANALPRLRTLVLLVFSLVAVGIVSLGSYGVMSQLVSNRERELAVRLVFGARPRRLGVSVMSQALRLTGIGVALGLVAVWWMRGLLDSFVFGVRVGSPAVLGSAGAALLLIALIATLAPAARAMRVDIRRGIAG
jgi:putative ABC transport system permease protein